MKKSTILVFLLTLSFGIIAQSGKVFDDLSMNSEILKMERKYSIYLPPDYESSQRSYPVLYLLHGGGDDQSGWVQFGEVLHIADKGIREGKCTPMIIAMPDANTGRRGYTNDASGEWLYEDFFFEEFIPYIEGEYRIRSEKRYRAVAGLSMGGHGSFIYALHHPELFSAACPLSAGTGSASLEDTKRRLERSETDLSDEQVEAYFKKYSVLQLLEDVPVEEIRSVRWYIDCGDDDFLYEGNSLAHIAMRKKEIPHEFRTRDGGHTWTYWREALPEVLDFISMGFHQH